MSRQDSKTHASPQLLNTPQAHSQPPQPPSPHLVPVDVKLGDARLVGQDVAVQPAAPPAGARAVARQARPGLLLGCSPRPHPRPGSTPPPPPWPAPFPLPLCAPVDERGIRRVVPQLLLGVLVVDVVSHADELLLRGWFGGKLNGVWGETAAVVCSVACLGWPVPPAARATTPAQRTAVRGGSRATSPSPATPHPLNRRPPGSCRSR